MEIIEIYKPYLYSVQYDNEDENEFDRLFQQWSDLEFVTRFMMENIDYLLFDNWWRNKIRRYNSKFTGLKRPCFAEY